MNHKIFNSKIQTLLALTKVKNVDTDFFDKTIKDTLITVFNFYKDNYENITYNLHNSYETYYPDLYKLLPKIQSNNDKELIIKKSYNRLSYIQYLLKNKKVSLDENENYKDLALEILNTCHENFAEYIDKKYLNITQKQFKKSRMNCIANDCKNRALFNYKNERGRIYCKDHKLENMINKSQNVCKFEDCLKIPSFKYKDGKILYCSKHKKENMIDYKCKSI